jgi:hypothetical protein
LQSCLLALLVCTSVEACLHYLFACLLVTCFAHLHDKVRRQHHK